MDVVANSPLAYQNLSACANIGDKYPRSTVWAAWGTLITKRAYLKNCLNEIAICLGNERQWVSIGRLSIEGHPHHPLYLSKKAEAKSFEIERYLETL